MIRAEYRVIWRREGKSSRRRIFQTLPGAENFAALVSVPNDEIDDETFWTMPELIYGPVIETREVGEWGPMPDAAV
jgi:hypothetical protein